ncbi:uncharacterized protein B0P05DRAFT_641417 [Gilbertella persicaria]|uniref:uncharacterized protein n=1 Tax=Gilbertella persicaria TaxID=101096 RepID=UPI002221135A|nr:uncharacterized protein B0P05DRAFT_641417 [Gilbertella persicaria]KAI8053702.1 hypothetical protein B0P05DRAFT_641417 [Gilbertella persicaria]
MTKVVLLKLAFLGFYKVIKQGVLLIQDFPSTVVLYFGQLSVHVYCWLSIVSSWLCLVVLGRAWLCLVVVSKFHDHKVCSTQAGSLGVFKTIHQNVPIPQNCLSLIMLYFSPYLQGLLYKYHWTFKTGFPSSGSLWPSKVFVQGFNRSSWSLMKQEEDLVRFDHPD